MTQPVGGAVTTVLEALLALQDQDEVIDRLQERVDALAPRLAALDTARDGAVRALDETRTLVEGEERRQRDLEGRIADHRQRQDRNLAHLDAVKRLREATAAMAQVEAGRKVLTEEETELRALVVRVADGHTSIKRQEQALVDLDAAQEEARAAIAGERGSLDGELAAASTARRVIADKVEGSLLQKYDRIRRRRRSQAVFPLNGSACSCCDTAVPVQRRKMMATTGAIEVCEACGVLLYASV
jgi:predicted  nucleic acid-binding Zn-ribbon protein